MCLSIQSRCHCCTVLSNFGSRGPLGWRGKSSTLFVRMDQVGAMREKTANYKRMQELVKEWVDLSMELERQERASQQKHGDRSK